VKFPIRAKILAFAGKAAKTLRQVSTLPHRKPRGKTIPPSYPERRLFGGVERHTTSYYNDIIHLFKFQPTTIHRLSAPFL